VSKDGLMALSCTAGLVQRILVRGGHRSRPAVMTSLGRRLVSYVVEGLFFNKAQSSGN
jgi:hypothetical protein